MNSRSDLAATIKSLLPMPEVALRYGYEPNRSGFIHCPFHKDDTPSLKLYPEAGGWHCFGCGAGGDVIDFTRNLFNLSLPAAIVRLNADFGLNLSDERPDPAAMEAYRRAKAEKERELSGYRAEYQRRTLEYRRLWAARRDKAPAGPWEDFDPEYAEACRRLDGLEEWFENNPWK